MRKKVSDPADAHAVIPVQVVEPMLDDNPELVLGGKERLATMFKMWFNGWSLQKIGDHFGISRARVHTLKKKHKWDALSKEMNERIYRGISINLKKFATGITDTLMKDFVLLQKKVANEKELSPEERSHLRIMLDRFLKENRLADDKPTEISGTTGKVEHSVLLPPGVKKFGVIPPDPRVRQVEHQEREAEKAKQGLSIEDVEDTSDPDAEKDES